MSAVWKMFLSTLILGDFRDKPKSYWVYAAGYYIEAVYINISSQVEWGENRTKCLSSEALCK